MTRVRVTAALAALVVAAGAAIMLVALVARPGSWLVGYVSEAGTAGQRFSGAYRSGLIGLGVGVVLLAVHRKRLVATPLLIAAVLAGLSGAVSCSGGCPLPPFEPTTTADVVHTAAGVVGMAVLAAAMAAMWWTDDGPALRRLAATALAGTVPLGGALGLTMLFAGRTTTGAVLERLLLAVAVIWLVGTAALIALRPPAGRSPAATPPHPRSSARA